VTMAPLQLDGGAIDLVRDSFDLVELDGVVASVVKAGFTSLFFRLYYLSWHSSGHSSGFCTVSFTNPQPRRSVALGRRRRHDAVRGGRARRGRVPAGGPV
jgi:hypothetical protein